MQATEARMNEFMGLLYRGSVGLYWDYVNSYSGKTAAPAELYFVPAQETDVGQDSYGREEEAAEDGTENPEEGEGGDSSGISSYEAGQFNQMLEGMYRNFLNIRRLGYSQSAGKM